MEHLLECPVTGCTETCFESRDVLNCHMQSDHSNINASNAYSTTSLLRANTIAPPCVMPDDASKGKAVMRAEGADDKALKMEMSIGVSKKRCRDQLRTVLEKRLRRANGGLVKGADSPGMLGSRTPKLLESASFPVVWEHGILPFLIEFMPKWSGPGHVISVMRGRKPNTRRICIMTKRNLTTARRVVIAAHIRDLLPEQYRSTISFIFSTGRVDRLVWSRGLTSEMPDEVCEPRNPFAYISPCMGDSIGAILDDGEEATATLGPCVTAGGGSYWLACFHPFMGAARRTEPVLVEHPSPQDRTHCVRERHDVLDALDHSLGRLTATSGFDLTTTRVTHDPYWDDSDKEPPLVVTDWTLISSSTRQANLLRRFPTMVQRRDSPLVTSTSPVSPCASVISTGRTSGFQRGQIGEVPAYLDGSDNGTGKATREWFIEEPDPDDDDNEWIRGGIGVEGDSGAAVIDTENTLVGQLWGRNKYWGPGPRITFFTPISDIFDDIQEKCGMLARPQLPQYRDEADRWPVYPVCKQCYDLREYLDSRRCSRESLMSMIGLHDARGEHDNDLTSVSELATPKDQSCIMRHLGPEDVTSPFGNGNHVSPALYPLSQTTSSPGMAELRSPYPQALNDEDLYDAGCAPTKGVAFGKRPAVLPPQGESTTQHDNKRRRTTYAGQG
ncbi:putative zinc C2H2-like [Rosellinia necatrix]|uniref:Putative zinc C2H2-like n=1 Tax=Rosellinia necatrix TaxID=77044 RepID=A0A1W2TQN7_ROSNE|nr:putative zinc C2H2-like [Rosellinia necatrix]